MDQLVVDVLPAKYVRSAIDLLVDAFRDDPIFCFHFPDLRLRRKVLELFFDDVVRAHMHFNHVYAAFDGEALIGAAVWRPPYAAVSSLSARLRELITRYRLLALSPRVGKRLLQGFARLETTHPDAPHWYLFSLALIPSGAVAALERGLWHRYFRLPMPKKCPATWKRRFLKRYGSIGNSATK